MPEQAPPAPEGFEAVHGPVASINGDRVLYRSKWAYVERSINGLPMQSWARSSRTAKLFDSLLAENAELKAENEKLKARTPFANWTVVDLKGGTEE